MVDIDRSLRESFRFPGYFRFRLQTRYRHDADRWEPIPRRTDNVETGLSVKVIEEVDEQASCSVK